MPDAGRTCTECDNSVSGRALTCSATCRSARSRRIRENRASGREVGTLVTDDAEQAAQELLRDELRPVIREAITEELVEQVHALIGEIPAAIQAAVDGLGATDDNGDPDHTERRLAASLILKHTLGNQSVVPDINADKHQDLQVYFNLPRPDPAAPALRGENGGPVQSSTVLESKDCDACGAHKLLSEFVGTSDRCQECFDKMKATVLSLTKPDDASS